MAIGLMTCSMDTAVKLGMKARLNSKANTIKERKMGAEDTNGPMEATTTETSSTACSKVRVSVSVTPLICLLLGIYYFAESERTYEGQFAQNLFEGKGKLTFKDGRMYEGDFKSGKKEGQGTMVFPNGNKYIGQWKDDVQHGIGVHYSAKEGVKKQGHYANGKRTAWLSKPIKVGGG